MVSANALWILALPVIVTIEGWFMARQKWPRPYMHALKGNLWSMLAAIPLGLGLSVLGIYISSRDNLLDFIPDEIRFILAETFMYGSLRSPSWGFIYISPSGLSDVCLAALVFLGCCWFFSTAIEGYYYSKKYSTVSTKAVFKITAVAHVVSYCVLLLMWSLYSYESTKSEQEFGKIICAAPNAWSYECKMIFEKYPDIKELRLSACQRQGIDHERCVRNETR
jgi:hypothetical protein